MATERDEDDEEGGGIAQPDLIQSYLSFAARAIRNRIPLVVGSALGLSALVVVAAIVWPRTYMSTTQLMVQSAGDLSGEKDEPFTGADRVIMRRENIEGLVKQVELPKHWQKGRSPALLLKDRVMEMIRGKIPESALIPVLVSTLENRIFPEASERTLTIYAEWSDPVLAAKIADGVLQRFLAYRQSTEIATKKQQIALLEEHTADSTRKLKERADELKKRREERLSGRDELENAVAAAPGEAPKPRVVRRAPTRDLAAEEDLSKLRAELEAKRSAVRDRERQDQERVNRARTRLQEMLQTVTPSHPEAVLAQKQLDAAVRDLGDAKTQGDQEVGALSGRVRELERKAGGTGGAIVLTPDGPAPAPVPPEIRRLLEDSADEGVDPTLISEVEHLASKLTDLRDKVDNAQLELKRAEAAFKLRYQVVIPAEVPAKPKKPNVRLILAGGLIGSIVVALLIAILAQLRKGKIVAKWQVYNLGLPVLAEIKFPHGPKA